VSLSNLLRSTFGLLGVMVKGVLPEVMDIPEIFAVKDKMEIPPGTESGLVAAVTMRRRLLPPPPPPPTTVPALGPLQEDIAKMTRMNRGRKQTDLKRVIRNPTIA